MSQEPRNSANEVQKFCVNANVFLGHQCGVAANACKSDQCEFNDGTAPCTNALNCDKGCEKYSSPTDDPNVCKALCNTYCPK